MAPGDVAAPDRSQNLLTVKEHKKHFSKLYHVAGGVHLRILETQRGYGSLPPLAAHTQIDKEHLIFVVFDQISEFRLKLCFLTGGEVAFENGDTQTR